MDITLSDLTRVTEYEWELGADFAPAMRIPIRVFGTEALVEKVLVHDGLQQAIRVTSLPGLVGHVVLMPDAYPAQGAPFGMVAASKHPVGVVIPSAIGHDINSGVRLLGSKIRLDDIEEHAEALADALAEHVPMGGGADNKLDIGRSEVDHIAKSGAQWALRKGMAEQDDLVRTEEGGRLNEADPSKVSNAARDFGTKQLGTLGGGEHFIEIGVVDRLDHPAAGFTLGVQEGTVVAQIHCGSRGYGQQICADYITKFRESAPGFDIELPDPQLACTPLESTGAADYTGAMRAAANFAYANRQVLAHRVRQAFSEVLDISGDELHTVYDLAHNLGQVEMHEVDGRHMRCYVHRKGATRALGPGTPGISLPYRALGQPVLVPGGVGQVSWVLLGTSQSMQNSFGSSCHGGGGTMSLHETGTPLGESRRKELEASGVHVRIGGESLAETDTEVRDQVDIDEIVDTVVGAKLATRVARIKPIVVLQAS